MRKNPYNEREWEFYDGEWYFDSKGKLSDRRYLRRIKRYDRYTLRQIDKDQIKKDHEAFKKENERLASERGKPKFTFASFKLITKIFGTAIIVLVLSLGFGNGTLSFIKDEYIQTHSLTTSDDDYEITFYNYDFTYKLKQISQLKPMLSSNSLYASGQLHSVTEFNPDDFYNELSLLVENGDITGIVGTSIFTVNFNSINYSYANYILDYTYYTTNVNKGFGGTQAISNFIYYDDNINDDVVGTVVKRDKEFSKWVKQYNNDRFDKATPLWDSILILFTFPEKLMYNIFVIFDFIVRW